MPFFAQNFEMLYHPLLIGKYRLEDLFEASFLFDVLIIEGAMSHDEEMIRRFDRPFNQIVEALTSRAKHIVCAGSCASFGGIFRLRNPQKIMGALYNGKIKGGYWDDKSNLINLPGCQIGRAHV